MVYFPLTIPLIGSNYLLTPIMRSPTYRTFPLTQEVIMKGLKYEQLDNRTPTNKFIQSGCQKIQVSGWNEVEEIEKNEPIKFLKWDEWEEYYESKYFCTSTKTGKLPL